MKRIGTINIRHIVSVLTKIERKKFLILSLFSIIVSLTDIFSIAFLFFVVNFYSSGDFGFKANWLNYFSDNHSLIPALLLLAVFALKSVGGYYVFKAQQKFTNKVSSRISAENLLLYFEGNYEDYINTDSAIFTQKIYHYPIEFANYILSSLQQIISETALIIIAIIALLIYSGTLLILVAVVLLLPIVVIASITKRRLRDIRKNIEVVHKNTLQYLREALGAFVESNIYDRNDLFIKRFHTVQSQLNGYVADMQITQGLPSRFFEAFAVFGFFTLIEAGLLLNVNLVDIFKLGALVAATYKIIPGVSRIINLWGMIKTHSYILSSMNNGKSISTSDAKQKTDNNIQSIEFRNVCFSFSETNVLSRLNLKANKGTLIGINGKSGKGKTTLVNLLLSFLVQKQGCILINDEDTNADDRKKFWKRISYVKQQPFILHDSILKNITLLDNNYNCEALESAIRLSGLSDLIAQLPHGIQTVISEGGKNLSGGQRQRIMIARALYKDADVILLDEPFSELDEGSEIDLLHHFKNLSKSRIIFLITHNSESLSFCDDVIYL